MSASLYPVILTGFPHQARCGRVRQGSCGPPGGHCVQNISSGLHLVPHRVSFSPLVPGTHSSAPLLVRVQLSRHSLSLAAQDVSFASTCTGWRVSVASLIVAMSSSLVPVTCSIRVCSFTAVFARRSLRTFELCVGLAWCASCEIYVPARSCVVYHAVQLLVCDLLCGRLALCRVAV